MANWQGRDGLSADCKLDPLIVMGILMSGSEHPCDRCNEDRALCRGFDPTPSHAALMRKSGMLREED